MLDLDVCSRSFWGDESAVTSIEYALLAGFVAAALVAAFGTSGNGVFNDLATAIAAALDHAANAGTGD
jgi:Flp pilus assembly pilin Flp